MVAKAEVGTQHGHGPAWQEQSLVAEHERWARFLGVLGGVDVIELQVGAGQLDEVPDGELEVPREQVDRCRDRVENCRQVITVVARRQ